jgi:hypothetical protein
MSGKPDPSGFHLYVRKKPGKPEDISVAPNRHHEICAVGQSFPAVALLTPAALTRKICGRPAYSRCPGPQDPSVPPGTVPYHGRRCFLPPA